MTESEFKSLVEEHSGRLVAYAYTICSDIHTSQDIVQDVFLSLLKNFEKVKNHKAWLFKVCRNKTIDKIRMANKARMEELDALEIASEQDKPPFDILDEEMLSEKLMELLGLLDPADSEILNMKYFAELSYQEISEVLNISVSNVGVRIMRATERLKKEFKKREDYEKRNTI